MKVQDLTHEQIATLKPIKAPGLWFNYNGERRTPNGLYFSSDLREWWDNPEEYDGQLYTYFDNALRPVFNPDGTRFVRRGIASVCARYKNGVICDFYKE